MAFKLRSGNKPDVRNMSGSAFKSEAKEAIANVKEKVTGGGSNVKDKVVSAAKEVGKEGAKKIDLKGVKKGAKKIGAKIVSRAAGPAGIALTARDTYKFLDKKQVGQKATKNIGGSSQRAFLGKI